MLDTLQTSLDYTFRDTNFLHLALVHPSARNEWALPDDNQRLEYLGDAVLGLIAAEHGYRMNATLDEGQLTMMRSNISSTEALAAIARRTGLGRHLVLGKGEESSGGREKDNNLADTLEAVIGASYLDGGLEAARRIFARLFIPFMEDIAAASTSDNPKGRLQEWTQARGLPPPRYEIQAEEGPPHQKTFVMEVRAGDELSAHGRGSNKRSAEADAARNLLARIETHMPTPPP